MTRDPRCNPKPGDVLEKRGKRTLSVRKVTAHVVGNVRYKELNADVDHDVYGTVLTTTWVRWAKGAEVIHAAE